MKNVDKYKNKNGVNIIEEWLDFEPTTVRLKEENVEIQVGMDLGSTYTRLRRFSDNEGEYRRCKEVNSDIVMVTDISNIKSKSNSVYHNMEFIIEDVTSSRKKNNKVFNQVHFVKGDLAFGRTSGVLQRPSKVFKTKLEATYLNILSMISLEVLYSMKYTEEAYKVGELSDVVLAVTLPPEEFKSNKNLEEFKDKLAGNYFVELPRLGFVCQIRIDKENIFCEKESNAVQYSLANNDENLLDITSIVIDGGGKSVDISIMLEGQILDEYGRTCQYGGDKLMEEINEKYMSETGRSSVPKAQIERALERGELVRGGRVTNIIEIIREAKQNIAIDINNDILATLDRAGISLDDVEALTFHGRLFSDTLDYKEGRGGSKARGEVINIKDMMLERLSGIFDGLQCNHVVSTDCISEGVIISRWVELS